MVQFFYLTPFQPQARRKAPASMKIALLVESMIIDKV